MAILDRNVKLGMPILSRGVLPDCGRWLAEGRAAALADDLLVSLGDDEVT